MTIEINDGSFEAEVLKSDLPVVVDFWAPWCGPCRMVGPVVDKLAEEFNGKVKFCKLNVDENPVIAQQFGIMSIPTIILFSVGKPVKQFVGVQSKEQQQAQREPAAGAQHAFSHRVTGIMPVTARRVHSRGPAQRRPEAAARPRPWRGAPPPRDAFFSSIGNS